MTIEVSVVVSSYNRAQLLEGTLRALVSQKVPDSLKWEIVVVDNNSRDTTAQLVADFSKSTLNRRELFAAIGGFDTGLGAVANRLYRGEEVELINRALQRGFKIVYDPAVTVFHRVGPERMRKVYFRKLSFYMGMGEVSAKPVGSERSFLGAPVWLYRAVFAGLWKWLRLLILRRPGAFDQQLDWLWSVGRLSGYWTGR